MSREYFKKQEEEISNKYMSANGEGVGNTVKQAGLGAGLFTMAVLLVGAVYLLNQISKQMDKK